MFLLREYSDLQIRQKHNSKMLYSSYLESLRQYNLQYRYKMFWQKHRGGYELLAKENLRTGKREYLGRRDAETEAMLESFRASKRRIKERLKSLRERLKRDAKLNKIEGIARAPKELTALLRKINESGLDEKLIVIGTHSLYAYEARAGIMIEEEHLATHDIDLLNRREKKLSFLFRATEGERDAHAFLQSVDKSFQPSDAAPYRFINKDGVWIELIEPSVSGEKAEAKQRDFFADLLPLDMEGMHWLENSRLFTETVIGLDGSSAEMTTIHPLEYAVYKNWLSQKEDRDYLKHIRDQEQSRLVTRIIAEYMPDIEIGSELKKLRHFSKAIVDDYRTRVLDTINSS